MIALLLSCAAVLDDNTPYVDEPRVLAVQMEPAEVEAGAEVQLWALYADASGLIADASIDWSFCTALKPLAELGPVAQTCLDPASTDLSAIGSGITVSGTVPDNACSLYGPNPPAPVAGGSAGRPTDPDVTGGFHQPVLGFDATGGTTLASVRLRCGPANVDQETYVAWNLSYHSNQNPAVLTFRIDGEEATPEGPGEALMVAPGQVVTLEASWPDCPTEPSCGDQICSAGEDSQTCAEDCSTPSGCGGSEPYYVFDVPTGVLVLRKEAISASWFSTGGLFDEARNGRAGNEAETSVENTWTAPDEPGEAWMAVVLRDERGGIGFNSYRVIVSP